MPSAHLHLERLTDDLVRVRVTGELERRGIDTLLGSLNDFAAAARMEVDLHGVSFIDSSGLHYLADLEARNRDHGIQTTFVVSNATMVRAFDAVGFLKAFDVRQEPKRGRDPEHVDT